MTELLIVIGIIVLVLAVAMPAFNLITGTKSNEMAINQISAFLARARNEAIGVQQYRGVFFYLDPRSGRVTMALVAQAERPAQQASNVDLYLDLAGGDPMALPRGVGMQFIDDGGTINEPNDRYIGFNRYNNFPNAVNNPQAGPNNPLSGRFVRYGGVILFDAAGKLAHRSYALLCRRKSGSSGAWEYTAMGRLLYQDDPTILNSMVRDVVPVHAQSFPDKVIRSQLGFVLFDRDAFRNQFAGDDADDDRQIINPPAPYRNSPEEAEENWLDANAVPVLINRYNGTIVKGE